MPSINYMNQSAPFWDFVAGLEQQAQQPNWFSQFTQPSHDDATRGERGPADHPPPPPPFGPWGWGHSFGGQGFPHRGPPQGPPPQEEQAGEKETENEKDKDNENNHGEARESGSDNEGWPRGRGRHGRCGGRRGRDGFGPRGHHGRGGFGSHHHHHGRRGGWGPWARGEIFGNSTFNPWAFASGLYDATNNQDKDETEDFSPDADIFDTESAFVIHVSLPGAKKEDVGVNWDAGKSELAIAGVIYRPGNEEFLKTLAMDERKVGPFERKIRLGTRANPAQIDADMIMAKLEDGVLRIDVPKIDAEFVEVKKVDVE